MIQHIELSNFDLRKRIKEREICFGGNKKLKIFGTLKCASGRRMKKENRIFFSTEKEAKKMTIAHVDIA